MKKIFSAIMAAVIILTLAACGTAHDPQPTTDTVPSSGEDNAGSSGTPEFLIGVKYYCIDDPERSIVFNQDETFTLDKSDGVFTGDYIVDGETIAIVFGNGDDSNFTIIDSSTLQEMHGEIYALESELPAIDVHAGGIMQFGGYDWRVLDVQEGIAFIISDKILDCMAYETELDYAIWETCTLRQYLYNDFYDSFSAADQARIIT
ncbi:MAG: DUF6273 domain-containing protein [Oscillospiraceae bacterium]|nr:DUF6273 domain-containing protein [Oscillospiraceae bacterium]